MVRRPKKKVVKPQDTDPSYDYDDIGDNHFGHDSYGWAPYKSVAHRRADAERQAKKISKTGKVLAPVMVHGRKLTKTFWGQAWCRNLERYHDYESRLPRGRSYLRNDSVIDLQIAPGEIAALVCGSTLYEVDIKIKKLPSSKWRTIVSTCAGSVGSVLELLGGKLSDEVMTVITDAHSGLFPSPEEIRMSCSCPDWATMCKHVAATLYGVGVRLDETPELFFTLRGVDHKELISKSSQALIEAVDVTHMEFDRQELEQLFGIEISLDSTNSPPTRK